MVTALVLMLPSGPYRARTCACTSFERGERMASRLCCLGFSFSVLNLDSMRISWCSCEWHLCRCKRMWQRPAMTG
jgi:hypothetical protein